MPLWNYILYNKYVPDAGQDAFHFHILLSANGIIVAFQDYNPFVGILKSPWVGFNISEIVRIARFWEILRIRFL